MSPLFASTGTEASSLFKVPPVKTIDSKSNLCIPVGDAANG